MKLTIYSADCTGNEKNCLYPHRHEVTNEEEFRQAVQRDHVCADTGSFFRYPYSPLNKLLISFLPPFRKPDNRFASVKGTVVFPH